MFDDLRRNFLMNPANGLHIKPYKQAYENRSKDKELLKLAKYLKLIARIDDWSKLDHKHWPRLLKKHRASRSHKSSVSSSSEQQQHKGEQ